MLFSAAFSAKTYPTHTQQKKRLTRSQSFVETGFFGGLKRRMVFASFDLI